MTTLLDNAVKYTDRGAVDIDVAQDRLSANDQERDDKPGHVRISVTDTGSGIDADEETALFRPFSRGKHGLEKAEGSGLGLWGASLSVRRTGRVSCGWFGLKRAGAASSFTFPRTEALPRSGGLSWTFLHA